MADITADAALGSTTAHDNGHAGHGDVVHATTTGLSNNKLGMWLFLGSECLLFGGLISTYMLYRGRTQGGPKPDQVYDIPFTSISSFVLLMSSLTMVLAVSAAKHGDIRRTRLWLCSTAALGSLFVGGQVYEFTAFYREGLGFTTSLFGVQLLHAHRLPRRPRHRRHHHADLAGRDHLPRSHRRQPVRGRRASSASTGTSSTSSGSSSSPSST